MVLQHDRTLDHYGTEDTLTAVLSDDIGRYPSGMTVQAVLEDFVARLAFIESVDCGTRIFALTGDAVVRLGRTPFFSADATIRDPSKELTLNAVIFKAQTPTLSCDGVLIENVECF